MNPTELLRASFRAIRAHTLRSFLTLLGVIIGVATIVAVVGVISGLNTYVKEKIIVLAPDVYVVQKFGIIRSRREFIDALKRPPITWQEYQRLSSGILKESSQVSAAAGNSMPVQSGDRHLDSIAVIGITSNFADLFNLEFEAGRFFTDNEDQGALNVAVIGANTREELFPHLDPVGRTILIRGLPFRVIGLMPKQGRSIGFNQDGRIYIPLQVYRKNFMASNESLELQIKARNGVEGLDASMDEVRALFRAMRHTSFRSPDPFGLLTQESLQELWKTISSAAFILLMLISSVSLGVGGIVIMNIMLVSVVERTQEIGVRMALGARKRDIRYQFLLEAALLSAAGGVIGVLVGSLGAFTVRAVADFPAQITPGIVLVGILLSTLVGLAAGFLPAYRASNLVVIDAIRAE
ncbi:MAG TPA: ABC transporter permease [Geothrix sp.]|uniref:ABC transporter permease n=1 Tax=Geothrix TaxID=44675 RepID=UPI001FABC0B3|nr:MULTISPECIES: ABC transporter permease [Geothrix]HJV38051.1 ABC transporter permease [Geothrix sp.]